MTYEHHHSEVQNRILCTASRIMPKKNDSKGEGALNIDTPMLLWSNHDVYATACWYSTDIYITKQPQESLKSHSCCSSLPSATFYWNQLPPREHRRKSRAYTVYLKRMRLQGALDLPSTSSNPILERAGSLATVRHPLGIQGKEICPITQSNRYIQ